MMNGSNAKARLTGIVGGALLMAFSGYADAALVAYHDTGFIHGSNVTYLQNEFTISASGDYQATLKDFVFPEHFDKLGLLISANGTQELGRIDLTPKTTVGSFNFHADPGTYDASLYGLAGPDFQVGMYGVSVALGALAGASSPAIVPLPPTVLLLGTAVLVLAVAGRRMTPAAGVPAAA